MQVAIGRRLRRWVGFNYIICVFLGRRLRRTIPRLSPLQNECLSVITAIRKKLDYLLSKCMNRLDPDPVLLWAIAKLLEQATDLRKRLRHEQRHEDTLGYPGISTTCLSSLKTNLPSVVEIIHSQLTAIADLYSGREPESEEVRALLDILGHAEEAERNGNNSRLLP